MLLEGCIVANDHLIFLSKFARIVRIVRITQSEVQSRVSQKEEVDLRRGDWAEVIQHNWHLKVIISALNIQLGRCIFKSYQRSRVYYIYMRLLMCQDLVLTGSLANLISKLNTSDWWYKVMQIWGLRWLQISRLIHCVLIGHKEDRGKHTAQLKEEAKKKENRIIKRHTGAPRSHVVQRTTDSPVSSTNK